MIPLCHILLIIAPTVLLYKTWWFKLQSDRLERGWVIWLLACCRWMRREGWWRQTAWNTKMSSASLTATRALKCVGLFSNYCVYLFKSSLNIRERRRDTHLLLSDGITAKPLELFISRLIREKVWSKRFFRAKFTNTLRFEILKCVLCCSLICHIKHF